MNKREGNISNTMLYLSPIGQMRVHCEDGFIVKIDFLDGDDGQTAEDRPQTSDHHPTLNDCQRQLDEYFTGKRKQFDIPYRTSGTDFSEKVWQQLTQIPFGETICYAELAHRIGKATAIRAVGGANNRNPLSLVIPCHRVVGKDGSLTGYAGGLWRKKWLLNHEKTHL